MKRFLVLFIILLSLSSCNSAKNYERVNIPTNVIVSFSENYINFEFRVLSFDKNGLDMKIISPSQLEALLVSVDNEKVKFSKDDLTFEYNSKLVSKKLQMIYFLYDSIFSSDSFEVKNKTIELNDIYNSMLTIDENYNIITANIDGILFEFKGDEKIEGDTA